MLLPAAWRNYAAKVSGISYFSVFFVLSVHFNYFRCLSTRVE